MLAAAVSEDAAQDGNVLIEIVLFDDGVRPDRLHQLVFADGFSAVLHQVEQGVKHLGRQWHWRAVACQRALTGVNVERAELVDLVRGMGHGVSYVLRNIQETPKTSLVALDILYELGSHCSFLRDLTCGISECNLDPLGIGRSWRRSRFPDQFKPKPQDYFGGKK